MADVEIYTKFTCSFCVRAKRLLDSKGVQYKEVPVDQGGEPRQEMLARSNGRSTVPQIFIGGRHVGGYAELAMLDRRGALDQLLSVS